jgi:hypothetical protein
VAAAVAVAATELEAVAVAATELEPEVVAGMVDGVGMVDLGVEVADLAVGMVDLQSAQQAPSQQ